VIDVFSN